MFGAKDITNGFRAVFLAVVFVGSYNVAPNPARKQIPVRSNRNLFSPIKGNRNSKSYFPCGKRQAQSCTRLISAFGFIRAALRYRYPRLRLLWWSWRESNSRLTTLLLALDVRNLKKSFSNLCLAFRITGVYRPIRSCAKLVVLQNKFSATYLAGLFKIRQQTFQNFQRAIAC